MPSDSQPLYETSRIYLRELTPNDIDPFHEMQSDPLVLRYALGEPKNYQENKIDLQQCIDCYSKPNNDFWIWAVVEKASEAFVGTCALVADPTSPPDLEIGFRFIRKHWGKGFGAESANALIDYCIEIRKVPSLVAYVDVRNVASVKILEASKLSFIEQRIDAHGDDEKVFRWKPGH